MPKKNEALSVFLTGKRAAVTPVMAGIEVSGPRRVPGLRREEVAFLAGVSVDWYVRLEQGRPVTPSEQVLSAIARTLHLDDAEREYLLNLARPTPGLRREGRGLPSVRPGISRMIGNLHDQPAFVLGPRMEVLAGNELAWALLADFPARSTDDRNLLRWILTDPDARELYLDWGTIASEMVGVLQLESSSRPHDPEIRELVGELATSSEMFRKCWARPNPQGRTSGTKRFHHAVVGNVTIDWEAFSVPDDATQTLFVYTAASDDDYTTLRLLASWRASAETALASARPRPLHADRPG
ncbi:MAG: helix-turn-helix transcriptional regulator [Rhodococcus sp. (in: high G+C Gram-positive bacteria)]